ncbi:MAG TPA: YihY/virulence factor BrkB family protein [Verrucomicrobiae bacterium]
MAFQGFDVLPAETFSGTFFVMKLGAKGYFKLLKTAATDWMDDKAPRLGAALAFYTIFSLAPLMTIVVTVASLWYQDNASQQVFSQMASVVGQENAKDLEEMLMQKGEKKSGMFAGIGAAVMLLVGATGVFVQLQDSLNEIWEVKPKPGQGIWGFIRHRLLSFAMLAGIAFILLASLLLSAGLSAAGKYFSHMIGGMGPVFQVIHLVATFGVLTLLFALMFKYVPDAKVAWKDVWFGALVTAALFVVGKFALGMYLGKSSIVSTYAAAGALLLVLLWVYYTSQIVFFGAELTQARAVHFGRGVQPAPHAEKDEAKALQAEQKANDREKKKTVKESRGSKAEGKRSPSHLPQPVLAYQTAQKRSTAKTIGGLLILLLATVPFEKKIRAAKARA